jgi:hypothetical protein
MLQRKLFRRYKNKIDHVADRYLIFAAEAVSLSKSSLQPLYFLTYVRFLLLTFSLYYFIGIENYLTPTPLRAWRRDQGVKSQVA